MPYPPLQPGLDSTFVCFLEQVVVLKPYRRTLLNHYVLTVDRWLRSGELRELYLGYVPQGSWAHRTTIEPVREGTFDADIIARLDSRLTTRRRPREVLSMVARALSRRVREAGTNARVQRKTRCVRVWFTTSGYVDVVPSTTIAGCDQAIMNYTTNDFEPVNPDGILAWVERQRRLSMGAFGDTILLLKYLRATRRTFACPSAILTILVGQTVDAIPSADPTDDRLGRVGELVSALATRMDASAEMPVIEDPSCPGAVFNHRWNDRQYQNFRHRLRQYAARVRAANEAADPGHRVEHWRAILGQRFAPTPGSVSLPGAPSSAGAASSPVRLPAQPAGGRTRQSLS